MKARGRAFYARAAALGALCAAVVVAIGGGCDLNPQPIPPGFEPDATTFGPGPGGGGTNDKGDDGSAAIDAGASPTGLDAASDADTNIVGGNADGGDGATDAAADADAD